MEEPHVKNKVFVSSSDQVLEVDIEAMYAELSGDGDTHGMTMVEICDRLKCTNKRARSFVAKAIEAGLCRPTRIPHVYIDGRKSSIPAYIFSKQE